MAGKFKQKDTTHEGGAWKREYDDNRARQWTMIVYPDSAPERWEDILNEHHISWACSPLHDKDDNPDGEQKKAHWHIALAFTNRKSYQQIVDLTAPLNGTIPKKIESMEGMARYFLHKDNPEKYQYREEDIRCYGGFDIADYLQPGRAARYRIIREMVEYIIDQDITEFHEIAVYAMYNEPAWNAQLIDSSSIYIREFIKSRRSSQQLEEMKKRMAANHAPEPDGDSNK